MTEYERIKQQFDESAVCRHNQRAAVHYEPGCLFVECGRDDCKCRLNDGDGKSTSAVLIEWRRRFAK